MTTPVPPPLPGRAARAYLVIAALLWLPYGLYCFARPEALADAAGVRFVTPTGSTELRAMYGGLQAAIGLLAAAGALRRAALARPALVALAFLWTGLATARLAGLALDGGLSSYTALALGLETLSALAAALLLRRRPALAPPPA
jgi:hypothetical protein